jgi:hypothetical protein
MSFGSFSNLVASAGILLWLVITAVLYHVCLHHEFDILTAILISIASFFIIWRLTKSMIPLAYEGISGKMFLILWLVITGAYMAVFDPFAAFLLSIFAAGVIWSCAIYMMAQKNK